MIRYEVLPRQGRPYRRPVKHTLEVYAVREVSTGVISDLSMYVQAVIDNWSPQNGIRVEGYTRITDEKNTTEARGVIGYYSLHSTKPSLGILEVQDT